MKELVFNDGRNLEIQSVEDREGKLYVRVILTTSEQLKALFEDEFATRKMTLYENHKEQEAFENYNKLSYLKEEAGGIWEVEMLQREKEDTVKIAEITMQLQEANRQITDLQLAVCELYEGMGV